MDINSDLNDLELIVQGQAERNVLPTSIREYLSRCRTMTRLLYERESLRYALELDENGTPITHTGRAKDVYRLVLPMTVATAKYLFAIISIDPTLPRKRKSNAPSTVEDSEIHAITDENLPGIISVDPGANSQIYIFYLH